MSSPFSILHCISPFYTVFLPFKLFFSLYTVFFPFTQQLPNLPCFVSHFPTLLLCFLFPAVHLLFPQSFLFLSQLYCTFPFPRCNSSFSTRYPFSPLCISFPRYAFPLPTMHSLSPAVFPLSPLGIPFPRYASPFPSVYPTPTTERQEMWDGRQETVSISYKNI